MAMQNECLKISSGKDTSQSDKDYNSPELITVIKDSQSDVLSPFDVIKDFTNKTPLRRSLRKQKLSQNQNSSNTYPSSIYRRCKINKHRKNRFFSLSSQLISRCSNPQNNRDFSLFEAGGKFYYLLIERQSLNLSHKGVQTEATLSVNAGCEDGKTLFLNATAKTPHKNKDSCIQNHYKRNIIEVNKSTSDEGKINKCNEESLTNIIKPTIQSKQKTNEINPICSTNIPEEIKNENQVFTENYSLAYLKDYSISKHTWYSAYMKNKNIFIFQKYSTEWELLYTIQDMHSQTVLGFQIKIQDDHDISLLIVTNYNLSYWTTKTKQLKVIQDNLNIKTHDMIETTACIINGEDIVTFEIDNSGVVKSKTILMPVQDTLHSIKFVLHQKEALVGFSDENLYIWNHINGLLLKNISFSSSVFKPSLSAVISCQGLLFILEGEKNKHIKTGKWVCQRITAVNPMTGKWLEVSSQLTKLL